jgi:hypothetical protein
MGNNLRFSGEGVQCFVRLLSNRLKLASGCFASAMLLGIRFLSVLHSTRFSAVLADQLRVMFLHAWLGSS